MSLHQRVTDATTGLAGLLLLSLTALVPVHAAEWQPVTRTFTAEDRESLHLTLYQNGSSLVTESYSFQHPAGRLVLRLLDMPDQVQPRSVQAGFNHVDLMLREQRQLRDLLTPRRVMEHAVGGPVTLIFDTPADGSRQQQGTLLTVRDGIVVQVGEDILVNPKAQLVLPELPPDTVQRNAAEWEVEAGGSGNTTVQISYLTGGQTWSADYAATLNTDEDLLHLTTWVTVENSTQVDYRQAELSLVAGDVHRVSPQPRAMSAGRLQTEAMSSPMAADTVFQESQAADYHVYRPGRRISMPARSVRQFVLHQADEVPVSRRYVVGAGGMFLSSHGPAGEPRRLAVESRVEFRNTEGAGLGVPLPAGIARVFQDQDGGGKIFLGEDRWPALATGEDVSLVLGTSFDLVAERSQTEYFRKPGDKRGYEAAFRYDLTNRSHEERQIEIRDAIPGSWKLLDSSHPASRLDARTLGFSVAVPAGGTVSVTYRVAVH